MAMKVIAIATVLVAGVEFHALIAEFDLSLFVRGGVMPAAAIFWAAAHLTR